MQHLTPERFVAILRGELDPEARAVIAEHLDLNCLVCTAVLEDLRLSTDPRVLLELSARPAPVPRPVAPRHRPTVAPLAWAPAEPAPSPPPPAPPREEPATSMAAIGAQGTVVFARPRGERGPVVTVRKSPPSRRSRAPRLVAYAVAAGLGVVVAISAVRALFGEAPAPPPTDAPPAAPTAAVQTRPAIILPEQTEGDDEERAAPLGPRDIRLLIVSTRLVDGIPAEMDEVIDGDPVTGSRSLYFETESKIEGARYIFALDGNDEMRPIMPAPGHMARWSKPGRQPADSGTTWATLNLESVQGPLRIVAAVSRDTLPLDPDIVRAWRETPAGTPWISFDTVEIGIVH